MKKLLYPIISMYKRDDMVDAFSVNITIFLSNAKTKRFTISQYFRVKGDAITYRNSLIQISDEIGFNPHNIAGYKITIKPVKCSKSELTFV